MIDKESLLKQLSEESRQLEILTVNISSAEEKLDKAKVELEQRKGRVVLLEEIISSDSEEVTEQ